jgi:phosphonate transport system substrate-binding protein
MSRVFAVVLLLLSITHAWGQDRVYRFGVSPQKSASQLAQAWTPFLNYLSAHSGVALLFGTAPDSATFSKRLAAGEFDFCFVNPQQYVLLNEDPGYEALAREKGRLLRGLLVIHKDSPIESIEALDGAQIAFPSTTSFAASVLPQAALRAAGVDFTPRYVGSNASVYLNVAKKIFPAGGGITRSLELAPESVRQELKVFLKTPGYTPHAIASHPRISAEDRAKIQAAIVALENDPASRFILDAIGFKGIQVAADSDWDSLRQLALPAPPR